MNGREIGRLHRAASGALSFEYSPEWLRFESATPISLSLPLSTSAYAGEVVASFFDNLLPDNEDIRRRMQTALGSNSTQPFDLLARAGADCVGALQLLDSPDLPDVRRITATRVSDADIARILRDHRRHPLGMTPEEDDFRISIAGAQEKTAFLWYRGAWHRPRGATPTTHVFKLPVGFIDMGGIDLRDSVENEWLCLKIAAAFGLPVPRADIRRFEDVKVLVVERFDRRWAEDERWLIRVPQEDACQSLGVPPSRKYEADGGPGVVQIMDLLLQSSDPHRDRSTFFRANVVFWLLAAIDGHAKNFSLFLYPGGRCRLTPLYDIMSAYPLTAKRQIDAARLKMAMALIGKNRHYRWQEVQRRHWISTARKARFSEETARSILDDCAWSVDTVIEQVRGILPPDFPHEVAEPILQGLLAAKSKIQEDR